MHPTNRNLSIKRIRLTSLCTLQIDIDQSNVYALRVECRVRPTHRFWWVSVLIMMKQCVFERCVGRTLRLLYSIAYPAKKLPLTSMELFFPLCMQWAGGLTQLTN